MLISPKSAYAQAGAWAMNRAYDNIIIAALGGNSTDGDGTSVALPSSQKLSSSGGLTLEGVIAAKELLDANEVDPDNRFMVVNSKAMSDMLGTTEVSSSDFNSVKALVQGSFDTWLGFRWIQTELLPADTLYAYHKSGMRLGIGRDVSTRIDKRPDVSYATQVYLAFTAGATRVEEEKVVEISVA